MLYWWCSYSCIFTGKTRKLGADEYDDGRNDVWEDHEQGQIQTMAIDGDDEKQSTLPGAGDDALMDQVCLCVLNINTSQFEFV